jgi:hypothetical protein
MNIKIVVMKWFLFLSFAFLMIWGFRYGLELNEKRECIQWERESKELVSYYLLGWQYEQCKHYGFDFVDSVPTYFSLGDEKVVVCVVKNNYCEIGNVIK